MTNRRNISCLYTLFCLLIDYYLWIGYILSINQLSELLIKTFNININLFD